MSTVDHPTHYNQGHIETIVFIEDQQFDFHYGNAVKYICRARFKGQEVEDLQKAVWYLQRKIAALTAQESICGEEVPPHDAHMRL